MVALWNQGKIEEAWRLAPMVDPGLPGYTFRYYSVGAAIRLGDADKLRSSAELIDIPIGRRFDVQRFAVDTGLETLEGDPDRAAAKWVELIGLLAEVESPRWEAEWKAVFGEVMPDRPEAQAAAREAFDWFTEHGALGYLELYSHVWERLPKDEAAAS